MSKTVLLTGATGFIGSYLLENLLSLGHKVIVLKRSNSDTWRIDHLLSKVTVFNMDENDLERVFVDNKIDCVMHLATNYVKFNDKLSDVAEMINFNVNIASQLCELCIKHGVKNFINSGTMTEYTMKETPIKEGDERVAYNLFSATKVAFDAILQFYAKRYKLRVIDLKLFAPFGEKDNPKVLVFLTKSLIEDKEIDFSGGDQKWNFTYVRDVADAYICALNYLDKNSGYESFNIGYDEARSLKDCVSMLEQISGKKLKINFGAKPYIENEIFYVNCENNSAKTILGWQPKYNLESGLRFMYDYYKTH